MSDETDQDYTIAVEEASEALNAIACPYYRGVGSCASGCYTEPFCQADTPTGGWEQQLLDAARTIHRITHNEGTSK